MAQALIPLKDLLSAKSRLSGILRPQERRALAQAMAEDVLLTLTSHPDIDQVTLVSDDSGAELLACKYSIEFIDERSLALSGLNPVLEQCCDQLMNQSDQPMIILHGDIPLLSAADLDEVIRLQHNSQGVIIGSDRCRRGTNLLAFSTQLRPQFQFGVDSCIKHTEGVQEAGHSVQILTTPSLGLDIDEPRDLLRLLEMLDSRDVSGHTAQLLKATELGRRLELQLSNIDDSEGFKLPFAGGTQ